MVRTESKINAAKKKQEELASKAEVKAKEQAKKEAAKAFRAKKHQAFKRVQDKFGRVRAKQIAAMIRDRQSGQYIQSPKDIKYWKTAQLGFTETESTVSGGS